MGQLLKNIFFVLALILFLAHGLVAHTHSHVDQSGPQKYDKDLNKSIFDGLKLDLGSQHHDILSTSKFGALDAILNPCLSEIPDPPIFLLIINSEEPENILKPHQASGIFHLRAPPFIR